MFLEEIQESNVIEVCREIVNESIKGNVITLLCYEKDESICHRKFIKKIVNQNYQKIPINRCD